MCRLKTFKNMGPLFDANIGAEKGVNMRMTIPWSKWRKQLEWYATGTWQILSVHDGYKAYHDVRRRMLNSCQEGDEIAHKWNKYVTAANWFIEKNKHLEGGIHVPNGIITQIKEPDIVWTCTKVGQRGYHENDTTNVSMWKEELRQTKAELVRPSKRGCDTVPNDDWHGRRQTTWGRHDSNRYRLYKAELHGMNRAGTGYAKQSYMAWFEPVQAIQSRGAWHESSRYRLYKAELHGMIRTGTGYTKQSCAAWFEPVQAIQSRAAQHDSSRYRLYKAELHIICAALLCIWYYDIWVHLVK